MALKSINPFTNEVIEEFEPLTDQEVEEKIKKSQESFVEWKYSTFEYRKKLMLKAADILLDSKELLSKHISEEMGKVNSEAKSEVEKCAWVCKHYAHEAEVLLHREAVGTEAHMAFIEYEPLGTILGVMPWNFPFWQVFRFIAPTLMAGNVVLLKHASNVQISARAIENTLEKAGFPPGVFQNLQVGSDKIKGIIEHDAVKAVTLTGSEAAGQSVAEIAGHNIKKTVLELGGSNSFIVLEDADMDKAIEIGLQARMQNAGQSCIAAKRFIVHEKISNEFIDRFTTELNKLNVGDPFDEKIDMGPLSSVDQAKQVKEQVKKSVEQGAKIVAGGIPEKAVYPPTLVTHVKPGMPLFDEEVFGPVAPIIIAKDTEEAVKLSNQSKFGLGVSLFTNDLKRAEDLIPRFEDGAVFVNALVKSDPRLPFGGTKRSGYGRELAMQGIREFVNVKTVYIDKFHDVEKDEGDSAISMGSPGN
jgi:succinate-semialdehyde dehydrogenase/glutarate-semialdehyde dehydrogenase